jgi:hypothetical protein
MKFSPKSYINNKLYETNLSIKPTTKRKPSVSAFEIPALSEYNVYLNNKFNTIQLKKCLRYNNQPTSGNKIKLITRIYNYSKYSYYIIKVQRLYRGYIRRLFNYNKGMIKFNTSCINDSDPLTLSPFGEKYNSDFFSYKDNNGFIYGFNASSFNKLINDNTLENENVFMNPYNREKIENDTIDKFYRFIKLGKIIKENINIKIENDHRELTLTEKLDARILKIFQKIDEFGHITSVNWFLDLTIYQLKTLYRELIDIWEYRASLSFLTKRTVCPPHGNPFININRNTIFNSVVLLDVRLSLINIFENIVLKGIDTESQSLGAYYVLGALTMIHPGAKQSMPWLYESFNINNENGN